jgi:integrase
VWGRVWGRHQLAKLTIHQVRTAEYPPALCGDGGGLYLRLAKKGDTRSWVFRYRLNKKSHELGLGPWPDISLTEARERAHQQRKLLIDGFDPLTAKRQERLARQSVRTFQEVAEEFLKVKGTGWRNERDLPIWRARFKTFVYPKIGQLPIDQIGTNEVLSVIRPMWSHKTETAKRIRSKVEAVLNYATTHQWRTGDNPATARLLDTVLPSKVTKVRRHEAIPVHELPTFMAMLRAQGGTIPALALEFLILTAARSGEVLGATWQEIDARLWTIPSERIKAGIEHTVPLSDAAIAILGQIPRRGRLLFPCSDSALRKLVKRLAGRGTPHGMRSTFRDWCSEQRVDRDIAELCLAHRVGSPVEQAYNRTTLIEQRRVVMDRWASFVSGGE